LPISAYLRVPHRYLVNLGCIKPLCDLLTVMDSKIVQVALNGLENILRLGEQEAKQENSGTGVNPYCSLIEEAYGAETHTQIKVLSPQHIPVNKIPREAMYEISVDPKRKN